MERRKFVLAGGAIAGLTAVSPGIAFGSRLNSSVNIGIIGCGNRGMSVISSMARNTNINILAVADLFQDKIPPNRKRLDKLNDENSLPKISDERVFAGPKAYLKLLQLKELDAVLISSPAYTHPVFAEAAAEAGKHIYCEKPAAVDVAGCKRMMRVGQEIMGKKSMVIGFQIRHASPYVEMVKRIKRGDIGKVINSQLYYFSSGLPVHPYPDASWDEQRIRNQYKFRALSGGILLDQAIHVLDVCNWTLGLKPVSAVGTGGRESAPDFGDGFTNFQVVYDYPENIRVSVHSTQFGPSFGDVCARFVGTKGIAEAHYSRGVYINGPNAWDSGMLRDNRQPVTAAQRSSGTFSSALHDADSNKQKAFIGSIESGQFLNEAKQGAESTLSAILGREAATAQEKMSWNEMILSGQELKHGIDWGGF